MTPRFRPTTPAMGRQPVPTLSPTRPHSQTNGEAVGGGAGDARGVRGGAPERPDQRWWRTPRFCPATLPMPGQPVPTHSATLLDHRGGDGRRRRGRPGGGRWGATWRSHGFLSDDPAVCFPDPGDGSATCPDHQSHSATRLEGLGGCGRRWEGRGAGTLRARAAACLAAKRSAVCGSARERFLRVEPGVFSGIFPSLGGGGGRWRGRWRRRWGVCGAHLSGRNTSPSAWLPISRQYLGDLRNRSGGLAQR